MPFDDLIGAQMVEPEHDPQQDQGRRPAGGGEAAGGADMKQ
jgi:hypothetical protein